MLEGTENNRADFTKRNNLRSSTKIEYITLFHALLVTNNITIIETSILVIEFTH